MIDIEKIKKNQKTSIFGKFIYYFPEIDSTNNYAQGLAEEGAPEGTVVLTDFQTEGKGRLDKKWESSKQANILISFILRPRLEIERVMRITLASTEILISSLEKYLNKYHIDTIKFGVKWPNDILANNRKIAGILTESSVRNKDVIYVIVGIGLNVNQKISELSDETAVKATSLLNECNQTIDREMLLSEIITEFEKQYFFLERSNYAQVLQNWRNRCDHIGKIIIINTHIGEIEGKFLNVTENGILLYINNEKQEKEFVAGTIKSMKVVNESDG